MMEYSLEQKKILNSKSKYLVVIAGAGTGKTTMLTAKIKQILEAGTTPNKILAITFTKKAANEMKERIKNDSVLIYTFDALCYNLIKEKYNINIIKDNIPFYQKDVLSFHLYDANLKKDKKPSKYDDYTRYKMKNGVFDFNDIENLAYKEICKKKIRYDYILVDEFQDTNKLQLEILKKLITIKTKVFIVGDPDQSIYAFRGAYDNIFSDFLNIYNSEILKLTNNYRSNKLIIKAANMLIEHNKKRIKKSLVSYKTNIGEIIYRNFKSEIDQVDFVIRTYLDNYQDRKVTVAVLVRNHNQGYDLKKTIYQKNYNIEILTIHQAKGLEFDIVFILGLNKNIFPSIKINKKKHFEEERRLFFVAITRAREKLYLTSTNKKSLFIKEIALNHHIK